MVAKVTGQRNDTISSIPGNQMFVAFHTNEKIDRKGFHALIIESKYFNLEAKFIALALPLKIRSLK